jgi:alanyl-tRNA synthetase
VTTERLYYTDSYLTSFSAAVVRRDDGGRRVYLDRTAFYPTSGGQAFDTGYLGDVRMVDVVDEGDQIAHLLEGPITGTTVDGAINWGRRFDHMQQHTGQHLLSALLAEQFGYQTVSVHFGASASTLDLDTGGMTPEEITRAEARANALVTENRPVTVTFEDAVSATGLRKASDRKGAIRIVTIADLDRSACGGTHVRATGEIGAIHIRKVERAKKQLRLEFLCGARTVARTRRDLEILTGMATATSAAIDDLPALFEKQRQELKDGGATRRLLENQLNSHRAKELLEAATPDPAGRRVVAYRAAEGTPESLLSLAQAITALSGAVLMATLASSNTVLLATAADTGLDAGTILKPILQELGGRGGGSARLAQGTVPGGPAVEEALARLASMVRETH